ncbi:CpaF/VirB11 family protein [Paenibacillus periandrae]|uniref:CpaF/VirB11 family protein n=1 Tax=Paenibacillus periandrae TaxID=1761741 RepID=UPI001F089923|nr:CpaF/VirB11 family protein [Paenibacillus periandrae]
MIDVGTKKPFNLDEYMQGIQKDSTDTSRKQNAVFNRLERFYEICSDVKNVIKMEMLDGIGTGSAETDLTNQFLYQQKRAIIGHTKEVNYFKTKIEEYLKKNNASSEWFPDWFEDLKSAIFHENWGLAGIMEWKIKMKDSTSCKIIGSRIYFLINGEMALQEQTISRDRINQLITALMLQTPEKRLDDGNAEVYMLDGTRIAIFADGEDGLSKEPTIIFRKYIIGQFNFKEQAMRGTIPYDIVPALEAWAIVGFNVGFIGPVRVGKTTFLETWQSYEDETLEGIQIETDPEIPLHVLMPKAPIMQIVADGHRLRKIIKRLLRADGDYLIMAEARDAVAMSIVVEATNRGTRRVKFTYHTSDPVDFCYDAANGIVQEFGGDVFANTIKIAKNVHFLFEFIQLKDKSKKRLKGIYEIRYNPLSLQISIHQICKYNFKSDSWSYKYDIGQDKINIAEMENYEAFEIVQTELKRLALENPIEGETVTELPYIKLLLSK